MVVKLKNEVLSVLFSNNNEIADVLARSECKKEMRGILLHKYRLMQILKNKIRQANGEKWKQSVQIKRSML